MADDCMYTCLVQNYSLVTSGTSASRVTITTSFSFQYITTFSSQQRYMETSSSSFIVFQILHGINAKFHVHMNGDITVAQKCPFVAAIIDSPLTLQKSLFIFM